MRASRGFELAVLASLLAATTTLQHCSHLGAGRAAIEHNTWENRRREWCQAAGTPVLVKGAVLQRDVVGTVTPQQWKEKRGKKKDFSFLSAVQRGERSTQHCRCTESAISPFVGSVGVGGDPARARALCLCNKSFLYITNKIYLRCMALL